MDVKYFNLLAVSIPNEVFERYLRNTVLEVRFRPLLTCTMECTILLKW